MNLRHSIFWQIIISGGFSINTFGADLRFAWINDDREIEVIMDSHGGTLLRPKNVRLLNSAGNEVPIDFFRQTTDSWIFRVAEPFIDFHNYRIQVDTLTKGGRAAKKYSEVYAHYSRDYAARHFDYRGSLGVEVNENQDEATFRLWSPTAEAVEVIISDPESGALLHRQKLDPIPGGRGTWAARVQGIGPLPGLHYRYRVRAFGQVETALDPYARSMAAYNRGQGEAAGVGAIVAQIESTPFVARPGAANTTNFVGMEIHVRDATIDRSSGAPENERGTYAGMRHVLKYFKDLGITHLQFLPLQSYIYIDESRRAQQDDRTPKNEINYNWGYDPHNFFTPEGWLSSNASDPMARIRELQAMVGEIHRNGMGVILDVVYNHMGHGEFFERAAPGMYLRRDRWGKISDRTGAGKSLESRAPMVRRLIIDSLKYWQNVFHIDGFRFDLMGFLDKDTMRAIRQALHPETILYGEAWELTDLPADEATTKVQLPPDIKVSAFNDTSRDAFSGRNEGQGFVQGRRDDLARVRSGIIGGIKNHPQGHLVDGHPYNSFAHSPMETLNYLTIHDGFTLWDKINLSIDAPEAEKTRMMKSALAMLFTSQGRIVLHAGDEFRRSKPLGANDPNPDRAHTRPWVIPYEGVHSFHENSYASTDFTNALRWGQKDRYSDLVQYLKGLIVLRQAAPALRFENAESIRRRLRFIDDGINRAVVAYTIDSRDPNRKVGELEIDSLLIVHNAEKTEAEVRSLQINNPTEWGVVVDGERAGVEVFDSTKVKIKMGAVQIAPQCSAVLIRRRAPKARQ